MHACSCLFWHSLPPQAFVSFSPSIMIIHCCFIDLANAFDYVLKKHGWSGSGFLWNSIDGIPIRQMLGAFVSLVSFYKDKWKVIRLQCTSSCMKKEFACVTCNFVVLFLSNSPKKGHDNLFYPMICCPWSPPCTCCRAVVRIIFLSLLFLEAKILKFVDVDADVDTR
jgi:hypothetical protein